MAKYFTIQTDPKLFTCKCGECPPDFHVSPTELLLHTLDVLREQLGRPLVVTSGVRFPARNAKVGGVLTSEHLTGEGADLHVPTSLDRFYVVQAAQRIGVARIGLGETFVHIGVGKDVPQHIIWLYGASRAPDR